MFASFRWPHGMAKVRINLVSEAVGTLESCAREEEKSGQIGQKTAVAQKFLKAILVNSERWAMPGTCMEQGESRPVPVLPRADN